MVSKKEKTRATSSKRRGRPPKKKKELKKEEKAPISPLPKKETEERYFWAVGRRKEATAQVKLFSSSSPEILINDKNYKEYFTIFEHQKNVTDPLDLVGLKEKSRVLVKVQGGGKRGQSEAIRLAISRALVKLNPELKKTLRKAGFLTRDARVKERKKYGLKRARRAPQWQKR